MFKKAILLCFALSLLITCAAPVMALDPPSYYSAHSVDELIQWVKTTDVEESGDWGSFYPFISAARKSGQILTVQSTDYALEEIMIPANLNSTYYFFQKDNDRFWIDVELPAPDDSSKPSLDEKMEQLNSTLALEYEQLQYTKTSANVNGTDTAIYFYDGGEYLNKNSGQADPLPPTAVLEWMGYPVTIHGIGDLYGNKWDNAYLELFKFDPVDLAQYKWSNPFADVNEKDWFYGDVEYVAIRGLMTGTGTDAFAPAKSLSRGMMVTILYRMAHSPDVSELANPFADVPENTWYTDAVKWAYANNIVNGTGTATFAPSAAAKRQDLATVLYRYNSEILKLDLPANKKYPAFADDALISDYAKPAVKAFYESEVVNGKSADTFDPKGTSTRAEAAAMLHRLLKLV